MSNRSLPVRVPENDQKRRRGALPWRQSDHHCATIGGILLQPSVRLHTSAPVCQPGHNVHPLVQVLLPVRFLSLAGHWVTCLTLLLDRVRTPQYCLCAMRCNELRWWPLWHTDRCRTRKAQWLEAILMSSVPLSFAGLQLCRRPWVGMAVQDDLAQFLGSTEDEVSAAQRRCCFVT